MSNPTKCLSPQRKTANFEIQISFNHELHELYEFKGKGNVITTEQAEHTEIKEESKEERRNKR